MVEFMSKTICSWSFLLWEVLWLLIQCLYLLQVCSIFLFLPESFRVCFQESVQSSRLPSFLVFNYSSIILYLFYLFKASNNIPTFSSDIILCLCSLFGTLPKDLSILLICLNNNLLIFLWIYYFEFNLYSFCP